MFLSRNKKNNVYTCKPQFYYIKVGFNGGQNYIGIFFVIFSEGAWCVRNQTEVRKHDSLVKTGKKGHNVSSPF